MGILAPSSLQPSSSRLGFFSAFGEVDHRFAAPDRNGEVELVAGPVVVGVRAAVLVEVAIGGIDDLEVHHAVDVVAVSRLRPLAGSARVPALEALTVLASDETAFLLGLGARVPRDAHLAERRRDARPHDAARACCRLLSGGLGNGRLCSGSDHRCHEDCAQAQRRPPTKVPEVLR
jgi:hypothetical protein